VLLVGSIVTDGATVTGFLAGAIAVGGFLGHARPVLQRRDELEVRLGMVVGGLLGLGGAVLGALTLEVV
jgi:hypothetical protein